MPRSTTLVAALALAGAASAATATTALAAPPATVEVAVSAQAEVQIGGLALRNPPLPGIVRRGIELNELGRYTATGAKFDEGGAEIVAHDPGTQRLFVANGSEKMVDVIGISDPDRRRWCARWICRPSAPA